MKEEIGTYICIHDHGEKVNSNELRVGKATWNRVEDYNNSGRPYATGVEGW